MNSVQPTQPHFSGTSRGMCVRKSVPSVMALLACLNMISPLRAATAPSRERASEPTAAAPNAPRTKPVPAPALALGLQPGTPEVTALPGGIQPSFGQYPTSSEAWRFDFHGMIYLPLRFGVGQREDPGANQSKTTLHAPPRIPGEFESFGYTSVIPDPFTQLNFSFGNSTVIANVIVAARTVSNANGYFNPPDMLGINDAFITFLAAPDNHLDVQVNMGAFANNYGVLGEHNLGRYATAAIARLAGTGLTASARYRLGKNTLLGEAGFFGQLNKAPVGVEPAGWNGFADPNVGSGFAAHGHLGVNLNRLAELGGHYIHAFTRDDRAAQETIPDGSIDVAAADLRLTLARFGHLYFSYANTRAKSAQAVSSVIRILNAGGGKGLMEQYLGPNSKGKGTLNTLGLQFDLSLGNLLRFPGRFEGDGPDLVFSLFSLFTNVQSPNDPAYDGVNKLKWGAEVGYMVSRHFTVGGRYDLVNEDLGNNRRATETITGRVIFHSDWSARDQLVFQYSHLRTGGDVAIKDGYPPAPDPTIVPDSHVISILASMWW